jgi:hypothetical protein
MGVAVQFGMPVVVSQPNHVYAERIGDLLKQLQESKATTLHG